MKCMVEPSVRDSRWSSNINISSLSAHLYVILKKFHMFTLIDHVTLSLLFTNDKFIQKLNLQFRKINKPTNVLSFVNNDIYWKDKSSLFNDQDIYLGDIAFAYESIYIESESMGKNFLEHFQHLFVHSVLHLLGYHHDTEEEAQLMEFLEHEILNEISGSYPHKKIVS